MLQATVLTCPVCGAPFDPGDARCSYCGSVVVIETDHPRIDPSLLKQGIIHERIAGFRAAVRHDENDETARYGLGVAYFNLGLLEEAADELTQAARLMPENPHIQTQLGVVFADLADRGKPGMMQAARERVERALLLRPDLVEAQLLKARLHLQSSEPTLALETLRQATSQDPAAARPKLIEAFLRRADEYFHQGEWMAAVTQWREVAHEDPSSARPPLAAFLTTHRHLVEHSPFWWPTLPRQPRQQRQIERRPWSLRRLIGSVGWALLVAVIFFILALVFAVRAPEQNGEVVLSSTEAILAILSFLGILVGPLAVLIYRWRSGLRSWRAQQRERWPGSVEAHAQPPVRVDPREDYRSKLLTGQVEEIDTLIQAAEHVARQLERRDQMQRGRARGRSRVH